MLIIYTLSLVLYSVGPGVKSVQAILLNIRLFDLVHSCRYVVYVILMYVAM